MRWIVEVGSLGKKYKKFVLEGQWKKIDFLIHICDSAVNLLRRHEEGEGEMGFKNIVCHINCVQAMSVCVTGVLICRTFS